MKKHDQNSREYSNNYRKGKTNKKVKTTNGVLDIEIPRVKNATFEPILIPKHQKKLTYIEDSILGLYVKGLSTRDVEKIVQKIYNFNISKIWLVKLLTKFFLKSMHSKTDL